MEIDLLGRFAVRREGRAVVAAEFGGRRVRQLVRILAAQRGRVVSRDSLIEALWGDQLPADPGTNLNVLVNRARRALGEPDVIQTAGGGYLLRDGEGILVDVELFEAYIGRARTASTQGDMVTALTAAQSALALWGEPFAEDAYADWARAVRDRLEWLHQDALEIGAEALLAAGSCRDAAALAAEAVAHQPLREAAHLLLVRAYAAEGDQAAAVAAFLELRQMLADELGIDPSPDALALYEQLLRGAVPAPRVPSRTRSRPEAPPFVGREKELGGLLELGASQRIAVVSGGSGSGKSHLLDELCARTSRRVLRAGALLPEREEPWSLVRALIRTAVSEPDDARGLLDATTLAATADVLPELGVSESVVDPRSRRALAQQGLLQIIGSTAPSLLLVDDLQWADSSSLDLLALVAGRSPEITMVVAYRPEEVTDDSPVVRFLAIIENTRPLNLSLAALDANALEGLVSSRAIATALADYTDGTPFAVVQVARMLEREGLLERNAQSGWDVVEDPAPERVRDLARAGQQEAVWRHFERLPRDAHHLLATLSLLGRPVPVRILSTACRTTAEETIRLLRELSRNHLVRHEAEGFRVDHDLVGETIRARIDGVERAALHQQIADALTGSGGPADELARHLTGAGDSAAAAAAYLRAAKARLDRCAHGEAEQIASEALALDPDSESRVVLLEIRAEALALRGDFEAAREDLRTAIGLSPRGATRSRLLTRLAHATSGSEDILRASELADLALAEAGSNDAALARATYVRALVDMNLGRRAVADRRFGEALDLFRGLGDAGGMADILDARAMTAFGNGDITTGIQEFDKAAKLFTDSGQLLRVVTPRSTRGHGLMFAGKPLDGLVDTSAALGLSRSLGYAEGEAMVLWHHAEVLVECGRPVEALAAAEDGLALAQRIGHRGWTATTALAVGVALRALGDLTGAAAAFEESLHTSGEHLIMFRCWGHARLASVLLAQGNLDQARRHVQLALESGPELAQYEARLAHAELSVRLEADDADAVIGSALHLAQEGGHGMSATHLEQLRAEIVRAGDVDQ